MRDNFGTAAYTNNDGTVNWAGNWIESDTRAAAARPAAMSGSRAASCIYRIRPAAHLRARSTCRTAPTPCLSFDFSTGSDVESGDTAVVEVSNNGGTSYTTLETFNAAVSGSRSLQHQRLYLGEHASFAFRFRPAVTAAPAKNSTVDNVQVSMRTASAGTYTVVVDASNFNAGGALNGLQPTDGLAAVSPLTVIVGAGQDVNSADFGYGPFALISGVLYQDTDRDGIHDAGETTVLPNVTVWLYTDGNANGKIDGTDAIIRTYTTDANGRYYAGGITTGSYLALADVTDPQLPGGFRPTSPNPVSILNVVTGNPYLNNDIGFNTPPPVTKNLYLRTPTDPDAQRADRARLRPPCKF